MSKELERATQEWMALERKTLEQRKAADQFYDENVMKLIEEDYIRRNAEEITEQVENLIVSVGTSYEPIVLNISMLKPKRILFLYTEKSEDVLEKVVDYCKLPARAYEKSRINEVDPIDVYREVKNIFLKWERPGKLYIDFTGGTKAMSAAAALAGSMIDVQLIYVASDDYLVEFRKPRPGSERLIFLDNPISVFGDMEIEKAFALLKGGNYGTAGNMLMRLKETIPEPDLRQQLNFAWLLCKAYEGWDALEFCEAFSFMHQLCGELDRDSRFHKSFYLMDQRKRLHTQEGILSHLSEIPAMLKEKRMEDILKNDEQIHALMFTMLQNATARKKQEKYDMATLLMYRLLEMIEQRRLIGYNCLVHNRINQCCNTKTDNVA